MARLGPYEVHPFADEFPLIDGDEFERLVQDIKARGLNHPIVLSHDRSTLIDGRNRYRACEAAGVDFVFRELPAHYSEQMIADFIMSENVERRHLNPGQKSFAVLAYEAFLGGLAKDRETVRKSAFPTTDKRDSTLADRPKSSPVRPSRDAAASQVGIGSRTVGRAKAVKRDAPDLVPKVQSGEMSLEAADRERKKRLAAMPKPEPAPRPTATMLTLRTHQGQEVKYPAPQSRATFNQTSGPGISWAEWSWNPVTGCLHGCTYCYARDIATNRRFEAAYPVGFTPLFHHERLDAPANTVIPAAHRDDPAWRRVFVCSMADLYGRWVPDEWVQRVHASMLESPQWEYLLLTKFPSRYVGLDLPRSAWVGTSVDEQKRVRIAEDAFRRIDGVKVKWLSLEPLLEPLEFTDLSMFDWVVIGAQTETRQPDGVVRAFAPPAEWVVRITKQAMDAGCKVHWKPNLRTDPGMRWLNEYPGGA